MSAVRRGLFDDTRIAIAAMFEAGLGVDGTCASATDCINCLSGSG